MIVYDILVHNAERCRLLVPLSEANGSRPRYLGIGSLRRRGIGNRRRRVQIRTKVGAIWFPARTFLSS